MLLDFIVGHCMTVVTAMANCLLSSDIIIAHHWSFSVADHCHLCWLLHHSQSIISSYHWPFLLAIIVDHSCVSLAVIHGLCQLLPKLQHLFQFSAIAVGHCHWPEHHPQQIFTIIIGHCQLLLQRIIPGQLLAIIPGHFCWPLPTFPDLATPLVNCWMLSLAIVIGGHFSSLTITIYSKYSSTPGQ